MNRMSPFSKVIWISAFVVLFLTAIFFGAPMLIEIIDNSPAGDTSCDWKICSSSECCGVQESKL